MVSHENGGDLIEADEDDMGVALSIFDEPDGKAVQQPQEERTATVVNAQRARRTAAAIGRNHRFQKDGLVQHPRTSWKNGAENKKYLAPLFQNALTRVPTDHTASW